MTESTVKRSFSRLSNNVVPERYRLTLKVDIDKTEFGGSVEVDVQVHEPTTSIVVYSVDLVVSKAEVRSGTETIAVKEIKEHKDDQRIEFITDKTVPKGAATVQYSFSGHLRDNLSGFYRCKTKNTQGEDVYFACTKFEAVSARHAFPCWDEPAMKSVFEVTMITKKGLLALSNMTPVEEKDADAGWQMTRFEPTPKMSTYLLCFVVGNFDYVEAKTSRSIRVRVYTPVGKKESGEFALNMAVKALDFYEDYFKIPYPLSKSDLIAIPDSSAAAMENWGLITFRESCLLVDPVQTPVQRKKWITEVIAHELAHMWFGNLVTMEWWTYLWLNEGFATFMATRSTTDFAPEYDFRTQFVADMLHTALQLDALDSSHPVEVKVSHPAEVEEIFDEVSYDKGASIINMLHSYLGDENFRKGMTMYLSRHAYANTVTEDLWVALGEESGQPVAEIMSPWVKEMGFPLISVKRRESGPNCILEVKQEKFYSSASKTSHKATPTLWKVPLVIGAEGLKSMSVLLDSAQQEFEIADGAKASWINVNFGASGVYRVRYEGAMLDGLISAIRGQVLSPQDRFMLHSDIFAMVKAGYASTKDLLTLTQAYSDETNVVVWDSVSTVMDDLDRLIDEDAALIEKFHCFGHQLYSKIFQQLGWDAKPDDKPTTPVLRSQVLRQMVAFEDKKVLDEARRRFEEHVTGKCLLPADIRSCVYKAVAQQAHIHPALWDQLLKLRQAADLQEESNRIAIALGAARSKDLLLKVLDMADSNSVRSQDVPFVLASVARSTIGRDLAWSHFKTNFKKYLDLYKAGTLFNSLISGICSGFHSLEKAKEVQAFFQENLTSSERTVRQTVEKIEINANWLSRDAQQIRDFLNSTAQ